MGLVEYEPKCRQDCRFHFDHSETNLVILYSNLLTYYILLDCNFVIQVNKKHFIRNEINLGISNIRTIERMQTR